MESVIVKLPGLLFIESARLIIMAAWLITLTKVLLTAFAVELTCCVFPFAVRHTLYLRRLCLLGSMLHDTAFSPEIVVSAAEHHIFVERTFQSAIEEGVFHRRLQAYIFHETFLKANDPCVPAFEILLQA